jgi:hypothetical protein
MVKNEGRQIERSNLFILSYQLEGLCMGLRQTVPQGLKPDKNTIAILNNLFDHFVSISTGKFLKRLPKVSESSNPVDILVMAETLRTSALAFLSPEEISERKRIGFQSDSPNKG